MSVKIPWLWLWRRWQVFASALLTVAVLTIHLLTSYDPAHGTGINRLDSLLYDWRFQALPPQRPAQIPIVIVDIDERTLQREGRWPWDRAKVAELVLALQDQQAALIGFDAVFSEPGVNPAQTVLSAANLAHDTRQVLRELLPVFDGDSTLAAALGSNVMLGYFFHADGGKTGALPFPFLELSAQDAAASTLFNMPDYTSNLEQLTNNALSAGFIVAIPDADGIVRRLPLAIRHGTGVYASLALEMARVALGAPWLKLLFADADTRQRVVGIQIGHEVQVPVDAQAQLLVPYRGGAGSYPVISATDVLRADAPSEQLQRLDGALVLVGTSALGLSDLRTIPLQTAYPGVEAHANVLDTILQAAMGENTFYYRPDWERGATFLIIFLSGLLLTLALPGRTPFWMLIVSSVWLSVVVGFNLLLWRYAHIALPLAMALLMVFSLTAFNVIAGYLKTNRQKRAIQDLFGEYVPPAYVERMVMHPDLVSLESEQREMTVLFADIQGFTAISELLSAAELKHLLNIYLSAVTQVIFDNHGTIDKYVGDMVMAFWNAPLDDPYHAQHAVSAALAMQQRMVALRDAFQQQGLPLFEIGLGLSTGSMSVGDMGSSYRRAYTVLGDAVNLGSRIESLTRYYGLPVLVPEATCRQADGFLYRPVDRIRVKGKAEPVEIFQPICLLHEADSVLKAQVASFTRAIDHYRARRWPAAQALLASLLVEDPARNTLYSIYLSRMVGTDLDSLPTQWQAIYDHESKS